MVYRSNYSTSHNHKAGKSLQVNMAGMLSETKCWGNRPFWGLSFDYDPQWFLTEEQKEIQNQLIDLCRSTLRPNAVSFQSSPVYMSLGSIQNLYKLQNLLQIKFNNDLTYHRTKSDFGKGFFLI